MKLWKVRISFDIVVRSASEAQAREDALDALRDPMFDDEPTAISGPQCISRIADLPTGWNGSCRPYGTRDPFDRNIGDQLKDA